MNRNRVKLADIAELTVGYVGNMAKQYTDEGVKFLRSLNIKPFRIIEDDLKYISREFSETLSKSTLHENDLIIVRTGIPGTCCVVPKEYENCNCADVVLVRPNLQMVNPYYLAAYINVWGKKQVENNKVGAIQKHFNVRSAQEMVIDLPDLKEQNRVAKILCDLNNKIAQNEKINDYLEQKLRLLYEHMMSNVQTGGVTGHNTIASALTDIITGKEDANFASPAGKYKFFTCSNDTLRCDKYVFNASSILIAGNGDFNVKHYTGRFNAYQRTYVLMPGRKYYGLLYLASLYQINSFKSTSAGSIVKFITKGDIENIPVFIPDNEEVLSKINHLLMLQEQYQVENDELAALRDWLLPMLMNGQATIED